MEKKEFDFRHINHGDVDRVVEIMRQAKEQMHRQGKHQWDLGDDSYPSRADITSDANKQIGIAMEDGGKIIAYAAVVFTGEPAYDQIKGEWLSEHPYVVVHRLAVADEAKGRGIATLFIKEVERMALEKGIRSFKVDTNYDNVYMRRIFERLGFTYCGEIKYPSGTRMAYEKILS